MTKLSEMFSAVQSQQWVTAGNDVQYAFVQNGDSIIIYFQGSSSKIDWIRNFMFAKRPYKDMEIPYKVHRGFLQAWKEVEDIIKDKISDSRIKSILVIGYSHGAALAALCHECCWFNRPDIRDSIIGIGFEAPRIYAGFKVKKELLDRWRNFYVIRNDTDIVTHCPPSIFGYSHVGNLLHIGVGEKYGPITSHYPYIVYKSLTKLSI
jgi:predicted lipase